jgi:hypothetical protein
MTYNSQATSQPTTVDIGIDERWSERRMNMADNSQAISQPTSVKVGNDERQSQAWKG